MNHQVADKLYRRSDYLHCTAQCTEPWQNWTVRCDFKRGPRQFGQGDLEEGEVYQPSKYDVSLSKQGHGPDCLQSPTLVSPDPKQNPAPNPPKSSKKRSGTLKTSPPGPMSSTRMSPPSTSPPLPSFRSSKPQSPRTANAPPPSSSSPL